MIKKEKRRFKRYKDKSSVNLSHSGSSYLAKMIDYSLYGIGALIENRPKISEGSTVKLIIPESELRINGKVVWKKQHTQALRLGIETLEPLNFSLKKFRLSDILIGLQKSKKTGVLEIRSEAILKKIYVKDGDMIFSTSNQEADRLGDILLGEGKITKEQFDQSAELIKKTGKRQGTILVELGAITANELYRAVINQVERIIISLFSLRDGEFHFSEGPLPSEEVITLNLSIANLISRGIKNIKDNDHLKNLLPPLNAILCFSPNPFDLFQDIKLDEQERKIFSIIDGNRTIKDILSLSPFEESITLKTLCALFSVGILIDKAEFDNKLGFELTPEEVTDAREAIGEQTVEVPHEIVNKIEEMYKIYKNLSYYEVLGINENASKEEIKKAYFKAAKEYHPDKHYYLPYNMRDKLNDIFCYMTTAYSVLTNPKKKYNKSLSTPKQTSKTEIAQKKYLQGKFEFQLSNYEKASRLFAEAIYLNPSIAEYYYHYGRTLSKLEKLRDAEKAMIEALKLDPSNSDYLAEIGLLYLKLGLPMRAKRNFEKALIIDHSCEKAKEGIAKVSQMI